MDEKYWKQFSNENIERLLLKKENVGALDDIITKEIGAVYALNWDKASGGRVLKKSELSSLLEEVKPEVDNFSGVSGIRSPTISYNELFSKEKKYAWVASGCSGFGLLTTSYSYATNPDFWLVQGATALISLGVLGYSLGCVRASLKDGSTYSRAPLEHISLKKAPRTQLILSIEHEYTHHLQLKKGLKSFPEGQARSLQRYIGRIYSEREDNLGFIIFNFLSYDLPEWKTVRSWIRNKLNGDPLPNIFLTKEEAGNYHYLKKYQKPTPHATSNAFFSILEAREGLGIHKEIMAGKYQLSSF